MCQLIEDKTSWRPPTTVEVKLTISKASKVKMVS